MDDLNSSDYLKSSMINISDFVRSSQAKQVIMRIVAFTLSPSQINSLREEFYSIDTDRSGFVSMSELKDPKRYPLFARINKNF